MLKDSKNKMMSSDDKEVKNKGVDEPYFFPEHGITVQATSQEEAQEKLLVILEDK